MRKWATKLGPDVVYVSGRKRPAGESNGKSGNLNNALSQIYPEGSKIPGTEVVCVMDADQVWPQLLAAGVPRAHSCCGNWHLLFHFCHCKLERHI